MSNLPNLGAIIFELAPDRASAFDATAFLKEMETMNSLWQKVRQRAANPSNKPRATLPEVSPAQATPQDWETVIAHRMLPRSDRPFGFVNSVPITTIDEERFSLYTHLANSFRIGAVAELLGNSIRLLLLAIGEQELRELLDRYMSVMPPVAFPTDEALGFRQFMDANPLPVPGLQEMLKFEVALIEAAVNNTTVRATFTKDIDAMLADLAAGKLPGPSSDRPATLLEIGVDPVPLRPGLWN